MDATDDEIDAFCAELSRADLNTIPSISMIKPTKLYADVETRIGDSTPAVMIFTHHVKDVSIMAEYKAHVKVHKPTDNKRVAIFELTSNPAIDIDKTRSRIELALNTFYTSGIFRVAFSSPPKACLPQCIRDIMKTSKLPAGTYVPIYTPPGNGSVPQAKRTVLPKITRTIPMKTKKPGRKRVATKATRDAQSPEVAVPYSTTTPTPSNPAPFAFNVRPDGSVDAIWTMAWIQGEVRKSNMLSDMIVNGLEYVSNASIMPDGQGFQLHLSAVPPLMTSYPHDYPASLTILPDLPADDRVTTKNVSDPASGAATCEESPIDEEDDQQPCEPSKAEGTKSTPVTEKALASPKHTRVQPASSPMPSPKKGKVETPAEEAPVRKTGKTSIPAEAPSSVKKTKSIVAAEEAPPPPPPQKKSKETSAPEETLPQKSAKKGPPPPLNVQDLAAPAHESNGKQEGEKAAEYPSTPISYSGGTPSPVADFAPETEVISEEEEVLMTSARPEDPPANDTHRTPRTNINELRQRIPPVGDRERVHAHPTTTSQTHPPKHVSQPHFQLPSSAPPYRPPHDHNNDRARDVIRREDVQHPRGGKAPRVTHNTGRR